MGVLNGKKVYFPVESLVGLGHFNRAGKIVREMVSSGMDVTVSSGTFVDPERFFAGAELSHMTPYVSKNQKGEFYRLDADGKRTACPDFNEHAWIKERSDHHIQCVHDLKPDVMLTEYWPFDRDFLDSEMISMIGAGLGLPHNLRVASVRDIIDPPRDSTPEIVAEHKLQEVKAVKVLNDYYHAVLIHGDPRFVTLDETFSRMNEIKPNIIYTGYITDNLPERKVPDPKTGTLLVSCGSGVDGEEMMLSFLTAWDLLLSIRDQNPEVATVIDRPVHIVCGPRFYQGAYDQIVPWAAKLSEQSGYPITVDKYRDDFTTLLSQAAFSVSFAGYNTTLETLALDVPSLMIPKYALSNGHLWFSTEQVFRLEKLQQRGLARFAHPEEVQNSKIFASRLVSEFLEQTGDKTQRARLDFSGAANSIAALSNMVGEIQAPKRIVSLPQNLAISQFGKTSPA